MDWIDLKNEKPDVDKQVLLLTDSGVIEGSIDKDDDWSFIALDMHGCGCCAGDSDEVTHWQQLPEPPTK